jgi:hypothetical protein
MGIVHSVTNALINVYIFSWDALLTLGNVVLPNKPVGKITPEGHPGFGGKWPEYVPRKEGDSRCSCPALNAMANHGEWVCYAKDNRLHGSHPCSSHASQD